MKAAIIAGGKGTRLKTITKDVPKPLVKVGDHSIIEHQIRLIERFGITDILIFVGYKGKNIKDQLGGGEKWGVNLTYFHENIPLGTSGALKQAQSDLNEDFLVFYADLMIEMDLSRLIEFHNRSKPVGTLVVHPNDHPFDSDLLEVNEQGYIQSWFPKKRPQDEDYSNLVNAAVYILSPRIFNWIPDGESDFGRDIFGSMPLNENLLVAYKTTEYIKDLGTESRYRQVSDDYLTGLVQSRCLLNRQKAIFLDRDGTINLNVDLLNKPDQLNLIPQATDAIKLINKSKYLAICLTNQSVVARNLCDFSQLKKIHNRLDCLLGAENAYLDELYFCPHHPDGGYPEENKELKINCDCRKPNPGMVKAAAIKYHIDITRSWMIGDRTEDIQLAKNTGLKSILLRTGFSGNDGKYSVEPDYVCDDLLDAVNTIMTLEKKPTD